MARRKYFTAGMIELLAQDWDKLESQHEVRILALEAGVYQLRENRRRFVNDRYRDAHSLQDVAARQGTSIQKVVSSHGAVSSKDGQG